MDILDNLDTFSFVRFCLAHHAIRFGEFTLKSGRVSPYFFNAGAFYTGQALATLGQYYAYRIIDADLKSDVLFGPAYKGIPLASASAIALSTIYHHNIAYCFDRKEIKTHGETGRLVGAPLKDKKVIIIDDVITAGTAIKNSVESIREAGAILVGIVVLLDRQERGVGSISALQEVQQHYHVPVLSVMQLTDVIDFLKQEPAWQQHASAVEAYYQRYGSEARLC